MTDDSVLERKNPADVRIAKPRLNWLIIISSSGVSLELKELGAIIFTEFERYLRNMHIKSSAVIFFSSVKR